MKNGISKLCNVQFLQMPMQLGQGPAMQSQANIPAYPSISNRDKRSHNGGEPTQAGYEQQLTNHRHGQQHSCCTSVSTVTGKALYSIKRAV